MNRLLLAGTNSGCGKTTVVCALLSALQIRGIVPTAFKCGPDFIDPMFHRAASGIQAYNLDPFFLEADGLRSHLAAHGGELSVIEGAMGYYDGIAATEEASAYTVARATQTPVVLVVSARGAGSSLGAVIEGFARHRPDSLIQGIIFNDASPARYPDLKRIAQNAGVRPYGYMPRKEAWVLPSRQLGLLTAGEVKGLRDILAALGHQAEQSVDIGGLLALAQTASTLQTGEKPRRVRSGRVRLAVARDEAFCFLYPENLELLRELGCELVFFSPLRDPAIPPQIDGLYVCGGYPELYAGALSANKPMLESIRQAVGGGLPAIAEGGGFLYLHQKLGEYPMCGVVDGTAFETKCLQRFGYITITAEGDSLLCRAGDSIRSHAFHYWDSSDPGHGFTAKKAGRRLSYPCIHATDTLYAGFPYLYFPANADFAVRFVERMSRYES